MYLLANQRTALYLSTNQKLVLPEQRAKEGEEEDEGQQWCIQVHGQGLVTNQRSVLSLSQPIRAEHYLVAEVGHLAGQHALVHRIPWMK